MQIRVQYQLSSECVLRQEKFGGLLFHKPSTRVEKLNPTAYLIASFLAQGAPDIDEIVSRVQSEYGELSETEKSVVVDFVDRFVRGGVAVVGTSNHHRSSSKNARFAAHRVLEPSGEVSTLSAPIMVWWDITYACNLKCKQCYSSSSKRAKDELTTEQAIDVLNQLAGMGVFMVYFLGGEPFTRRDFFELLEHCQRIGLGVMISTNGWYVSTEVAERLAKFGVLQVRVSLDGATAETHDKIRCVPGSHARAVNAIKNLKAAGVRKVGVGPTIMDDNFHEAEDIIDLSYSLGADQIEFTHLYQVGRGKEVGVLSPEKLLSLNELYQRKRKDAERKMPIASPENTWEDKPFLNDVKSGHVVPDAMGCGGGRSVIAISATGKVRCCAFYEFPVGDLRQSAFSEIWAGNKDKNMKWLRSVKDGCQECGNSEHCSGSCPMEPPFPSTEEKELFSKRSCETKGGVACPAS